MAITAPAHSAGANGIRVLRPDGRADHQHQAEQQAEHEAGEEGQVGVEQVRGSRRSRPMTPARRTSPKPMPRGTKNQMRKKTAKAAAPRRCAASTRGCQAWSSGGHHHQERDDDGQRRVDELAGHQAVAQVGDRHRHRHGQEHPERGREAGGGVAEAVRRPRPNSAPVTNAAPTVRGTDRPSGAGGGRARWRPVGPGRPPVVPASAVTESRSRPSRAPAWDPPSGSTRRRRRPGSRSLGRPLFGARPRRRSSATGSGRPAAVPPDRAGPRRRHRPRAPDATRSACTPGNVLDAIRRMGHRGGPWRPAPSTSTSPTAPCRVYEARTRRRGPGRGHRHPGGLRCERPHRGRHPSVRGGRLPRGGAPPLPPHRARPPSATTTSPWSCPTWRR